MNLASEERESALLKQVHKGEVSALETLIQINLHWIEALAEKYSNLQIDKGTLTKAGIEALKSFARQESTLSNNTFFRFRVWCVKEAILKITNE